jgi:hypothetical protein
MALWRIRRIVSIVDPPGEPSCAAGFVPVKVTLHQDTSGEEQEPKICFRPDVDICSPDESLLGALNALGYTPADWDEECMF